jgi:EmrB/QacA subfamily drug resistance transporter
MINPRPQPCDEGVIRAARPAYDCTTIQKRWILAAAILGSSMAFIDGSVVNVALPVIERDLSTTVAFMQWVINSYTLTLAALILPGGVGGDRFGRRRVFVIGLAVFALASLWCGIAPDVGQLIAARAAQGVGAALLIPASLAIIGASFAESERGAAIGTWAGVSAIAGAVGPILGGIVVDHASWRWIFLINPLIALPAVWIALRHLPESRDANVPGALDWRGVLLVLAGLGSLAFGLIRAPESARGFADPVVLAALAAGLALLAAFVAEEWRSRAPVMPLALFRSRVFSGVNLLTLLLYAALGGAFFLLPFALIQVHGYTATQAGAVFLPFTVLLGALSRWSGGLLDRFGARLPLTAGPAIVAVGYALLALPASGAYWTTYFVPIAVLGLGMAVSVAPLTTAVINAVPAQQSGVASGINNAVARVAALLAVAVFGAMALAGYNRALDAHLASPALSAEARQAIAGARGRFSAAEALARVRGEDRRAAETVVKTALGESVRTSMWLAAALSLAGALCAAFTIGPPPRKPKTPAR